MAKRLLGSSSPLSPTASTVSVSSFSSFASSASSASSQPVRQPDKRAKHPLVAARLVDFGPCVEVRYDPTSCRFDLMDVFSAAFGESQAKHARKSPGIPVLTSSSEITSEHLKRGLVASDFGFAKFDDVENRSGRSRVTATPRACIALLRETAGVRNRAAAERVITHIELNAEDMSYL